MPSPFPGFDPFLEGQTDWSSFHTAFIVDIQRAILPELPPGFDARIGVHEIVRSQQRDTGHRRSPARN